jgi:regulatory protein
MTMGRKITALKAQKRNPNRINIYLDGEFAFGLSRIVAAWLQVGEELDEEKINKLQQQDTNEIAYQKAIIFLSARPQSSTEVEKRLTRYGFESQVIDRVVQRLRDNLLISDEQFAKAWVENRTVFRPRGHKLMALELRQKGVSDLVIQEALKDAGDEEQLAYQLANRYARRLEGREWQIFRQRMGAFLVRRGFNYETVTPIVQQVWKEINQNRVDIQNSEDEELENETF